MKKILKNYKDLLRTTPSLLFVFFVLSVVCMNLLANKTIVTIGDWFALDGGILVSWMSFLTMDIITKLKGPKAATRCSILAIAVNLITCLIFYIASIIPTAEDYSGFNTIFGGTWFILLDSTIAFLISALLNNFTNYGIGKLFKKDGKLEYITRSYISTFIGQFIDNFIFAVLTFMVFSPIFWDGFSWTITQCITCSITGAVAELIMEIVFSPIGYKICKKIKKEENLCE